METVKDLLKGINEMYDLLQTYLTWVEDDMENVILWESDGLEQRTKDLLESEKAEEILGSIKVSIMEDVDRIIAENFVFNNAIKNIYLSKTSPGIDQSAASLGIEFKNGLSALAFDGGRVSVYLRKHFEITPETPLEFNFEYFVGPENVRASSGFSLKFEQIPDRLFYPSLADWQLKKPDYEEEWKEMYAEMDVTHKLNARAEQILRAFYKDVQKELTDEKYNYEVGINHVRSSDEKPNGVIKGTVYFGTTIHEPKAPNYEEEKELLETPLSQISSRLDTIEEGVRKVYKIHDIKKLEDFSSIRAS